MSTVSASVLRLKLEVEEKKQAVGLLQRALVTPRHPCPAEPHALQGAMTIRALLPSLGVSCQRCSLRGSRPRLLLALSAQSLPRRPLQVQQRDLTVRRVKETEKELGRQLRQQRDHYEATIQRHLSFIDQVPPPGQWGSRGEGSGPAGSAGLSGASLAHPQGHFETHGPSAPGLLPSLEMGSILPVGTAGRARPGHPWVLPPAAVTRPHPMAVYPSHGPVDRHTCPPGPWGPPQAPGSLWCLGRGPLRAAAVAPALDCS